MNENKILDENAVIQLMIKYLNDKDYEIIKFANTNEKGIDIEAKKDNQVMYVEAKGATSSKINSSRFGKIFNRNQVKTHIGRALLTALSQPAEIISAIALPSDDYHLSEIEKIRHRLEKTEIQIYFVSIEKVEKYM